MRRVLASVAVLIGVASTAYADVTSGLEAYRQDKFDLAYSIFSPLAREGDPEAQFYLGIMYSEGRGTQIDNAKAAKWFLSAADEGNYLAAVEYASIVAQGLEVQEDAEVAERYYLLAGQHVEEIRELAREGDPFAQSALAMMLVQGKGLHEDEKAAFVWFSKAAEQGHVQAMHNLGQLYESGEGIKKDIGQAIEWYRRAADRQLAWSQQRLGRIYFAGEYVATDYEKALEYIQKAAEQGHIIAQYLLGHLHFKGRGTDRNFEEAVKWYRISAARGLAESQFALGVMYYVGAGVDGDLAEAASVIVGALGINDVLVFAKYVIAKVLG